MGWLDLADAVLIGTQNALGEGATYTRKVDGSETSLTRVIFEEDAALVSPELGVPVRTGKPGIVVRLADLGFDPDEGDTVTVRSREFVVADIAKDGQGGATLLLHWA